MKTLSSLKNQVLIACGLIALTSLFYSCGQPPKDQTNGNEKPKTIAMNVVVSQVPFWNDSKLKLKILEKELNIKTVFGGPVDDNAQKQINEIEALISQKVDGIIVTPTNSKALVPVVNKAVSAGIPVITFLGDVPGSKRLMYITSELEEASKSVADFVFKTHKKQGKVIILLGTVASEEQKRRGDGFKQAVASITGMKVVDVIEDKFDAATGATGLKAALIREGHVDYIFGCDSRSAAAAKLAIDELKIDPKGTVITGWDTDDDVLNYIKAGDVYVTAAQQMNFMTYLAVHTLNSYLTGTIYPSNLDLKAANLSPVPDKLVVPVKLIDASKAGAYIKKK